MLLKKENKTLFKHEFIYLLQIEIMTYITNTLFIYTSLAAS
jgi:hypothetical protein